MRSKRLAMMTLVMACQTNAPKELGQFGEEEALTCQVASRTLVDVADSVDVGYVDSLQTVDVGTVLGQANGVFEETLEWSDGTQTQVLATLVDAAVPELVVSESADGPGTGKCPTYLAFSVSVNLVTADGRMDDLFTGEASMFNDRISISHRITALGGSVDVQGLAQPGVNVEPDEIRVSLWLRDDATRFGGQLLPQPIGGIDDDATSLGSWPPDTSR